MAWTLLPTATWSLAMTSILKMMTPTKYHDKVHEKDNDESNEKEHFQEFMKVLLFLVEELFYTYLLHSINLWFLVFWELKISNLNYSLVISFSEKGHQTSSTFLIFLNLWFKKNFKKFENNPKKTQTYHDPLLKNS